MPISICSIHTDASHREITPHGTEAFPLACYNDDLQYVSVPWHWHDELEFIVMQEGCAAVTVDSEITMLMPGEGFFINSGCLHSVTTVENKPCRFISVVFHPRLVGGSPDSVFWRDYLQPLMNHPLLPCLHLRPDMNGAKESIQAVEYAWIYTTRETPGYEFEARSCLSTLVYHLKRMLPISSTPAKRSQRYSGRIKTMLSFIHEHYAEEISTRAIAASASISESECLRCFRSTIDSTPIQYLRSYRIERAATMLVSTKLHIAEIGAACGFQEMSYFAKTFREICGYTPSEYRKQNKPAL